MIIGKYSNGANLMLEGFFHYVSYDDCNICHGRGYIRKAQRNYYTVSNFQCYECIARFHPKSWIKDRIEAILSEVDTLLRKTAKEKQMSFSRKYLKPDALQFVTDLAHSDLAHEYRKLLVEWWTYQEPELIYIEDGK